MKKTIFAIIFQTIINFGIALFVISSVGKLISTTTETEVRMCMPWDSC